MFKKRHLLFLMVLLLVIMAAVGIEQHRIYAVCRDKLVSMSMGRLSYEDLKHQYQSTHFFLDHDHPAPIAVVFDNGHSVAWCYVRRNGSKWQVTFILGSSRLP